MKIINIHKRIINAPKAELVKLFTTLASKEDKLWVLKFGTTAVCDSDTLETKNSWMQSVAEDVKTLMEKGHKIIIFSSGGLAVGKKRLRKYKTKEAIFHNKQLLGAVGLSELLFQWQKNFDQQGIATASLAIRKEDLESTSVCKLIDEMTSHNIVPIINENIPLQNHFNNDELAAMLCKKIKADRFVLFTDTDGVFTDNPKINPAAKHIKLLNIDKINIKFVDNKNALGSGGMQAKLAAAIKVKQQGIETLIANGTGMHPLENLKYQGKYTLLINDDIDKQK